MQCDTKNGVTEYLTIVNACGVYLFMALHFS